MSLTSSPQLPVFSRSFCGVVQDLSLGRNREEDLSLPLRVFRLPLEALLVQMQSGSQRALPNLLKAMAIGRRGPCEAAAGFSSKMHVLVGCKSREE